MASMHSKRAAGDLAAFVRLAAQPIPRLSFLVNGVLVVFGIGVPSVLTWLGTPAVRHVRIAHHVASVSTSNRWAWGVVVGVGVVALLLLWAGVRLAGEVASRARLVFVGADSAFAPVFHGPLVLGALPVAASGSAAPSFPIAGASAAMGYTSAFGPTATGVGASGPPGSPQPKTLPGDIQFHQNEYVRALVKNEPISGFGADAENVAARIEFIAGDGTLLLAMTGRWAEAKQRLETGRLGISHDAAQLTISANGLAHELDVGLKAPGDSQFYAVNDENATATDHRLEKHRMDVSECSVRIELRASNTPSVVGIFDLLDDGEHLTLTERAG